MLGQTHFKVSTFCMGLNGKFGGLSFQIWQQFGPDFASFVQNSGILGGFLGRKM